MRRFRGLAARLVLAEVLVITAGAASLALVSLALAPAIFRRHVRAALGTVPAGELDHLDHAFQDTLAIALAIAVGVAALTALAISLLLAGRIAAPIRRLADAAERVARGQHGVRVSLGGADELRAVSCSFNAMAATLERSEQQRRAFVSDIAHELRTPIATIDGYLEGLADGVVASDAVTWELLCGQTRRMRRLVDDLGTLARAEEGRLDMHLESIDVAAILNAASDVARAAFNEKQVGLVVEATPHAIVADVDRLGEVLANLLANALRHTPAGGTVTLSAGRSDDHARIVVADTGDGIPLDQLEQIFERLHRVDPSRSRATGGSGLGLAISRAIVALHSGSIHAESDGPGHGTRIVIELPSRS